MRFTINQKVFGKIIQDVQRALASHTTLPILSGILIKAKDNEVIVAATDLEMGIESRGEAKVLEEGSIVLPGQHLSNIIRELPVDDVSITLKDDLSIEIDCRNSNYCIKGFDPGDFPSLPQIEAGLSISLPQSLLKKALEEVKFAASTDENQPFLHGALLTIKSEGKVELAATNTYRLACREFVLPQVVDLDEEIKIIIPLKTLHELARLLQNEGDVTMTIKGNHIIFSFAPLLITSRLKEGQFPNYRQIIPDSFSSVCTVNRQDLLQAVRRASLIAREDSNAIEFLFRSKELEINTTESKIGRAKEIVPGELAGPEIKIAFTADYIIDVLKVIENDLAGLYIKDNRSPCVVRGLEDTEYTYILMPIQIRGE